MRSNCPPRYPVLQSPAWGNQIEKCGVAADGLATKGDSHAPTPNFITTRWRRRWFLAIDIHCNLVVRHRDEWFIKFHGQVYGPYKTERRSDAVRYRCCL